MKAITLLQPYAHIAVRGFNDPFTGKKSWMEVINQTWRDDYSGPLVIHASLSRDALDEVRDFPGVDVTDLSFGACLGIVELVDCVSRATACKTSLRWAVGPWCYRIQSPRAFPTPIPCRGQRGLWDVPDELREKIQGFQSIEPVGSVIGRHFPKPLRNRLGSKGGG